MKIIINQKGLMMLLIAIILNMKVKEIRTKVYPYEHKDSWKRSNETTLPNKKAFTSKLYLEDITDKRIYTCSKSI